MQANILSLHTPSTSRVGSKVKTFFFPESSYLGYQITLMGMENRAPCKHIFCPYTYPRPHPTPGVGMKGQNTFFLLKVHVVMLHIKLKGMEQKAQCKHIFCPYMHPQPPDGVKRLLKVVMLHIKLKVMELRAPCKHIFCPYTHPQPVGWIKL